LGPRLVSEVKRGGTNSVWDTLADIGKTSNWDCQSMVAIMKKTKTTAEIIDNLLLILVIG
jgi:hypothetical protein